MNAIRSADLFLLDKMAQPSVDWLSRRWGVQPEKLAVTLFKADTGIYIGWAVWGMIIDIEFGAILGVLSAILCIFWGIYVRQVIEFNNITGLNRIILFSPRMVLIASVISNALVVVIPPITFRPILPVIFHLILAAIFYVLSCQKPPPREHREPLHSRAAIESAT